MTVAPDGTVEFSRRLRLDRLAAGDVEKSYFAEEGELAALAERFGLVALHALSGRLTITRPADGPVIRLEGSLSAEVTQTCVVTLEPFTSRIEDSFVQLFTLDDSGEDESEVFAAPEDEEAPEPVSGGAIDLGEVLAEQLALALDPHPRKPGAAFSGAYVGESGDEAEEEEERNPFAVLKDMKPGSR